MFYVFCCLLLEAWKVLQNLCFIRDVDTPLSLIGSWKLQFNSWKLRVTAWLCGERIGIGELESFTVEIGGIYKQAVGNLNTISARNLFHKVELR